MKDVHAYGVELKAGYDRMLSRSGSWGWTATFVDALGQPGEAFSKGDRSLGRQLPYVPVYSAAVTGRLAYKAGACYTSGAITASGSP